MLTCHAISEDYYACHQKFYEHWLYQLTMLLTYALLIILGYFWFKLVTRKAKEVTFDSVLTLFLSFFIASVLLNVDFKNYLDKFFWAGIFSIGSIIHYARSKSKIIKY